MSATGMSRNTINHWLSAGVPWRHFPALKAAAAKRRIPGITDEALASTRVGSKPPPKIRRSHRCAA